MGVIRTTYNLIMGLIGLLVLGVFAYLFFLGEWQEYQEQEYAEDREEVVNSIAEAARKRGLGDLNQLRQEYLDSCPIDESDVREGNAKEICTAMADALLEQSKKREMTLADQGEVGYRFCALEVQRDGDDPDEYCDRQYTIDETLTDAMALALCSFDRAWIIDPRSEDSVKKRGPVVYAYDERRVDCNARQFIDSYYEGFFDAVPGDEEWSPFMEELYEALESDDPDSTMALLDTHKFGEDQKEDHWILSLFLEDRFEALLPKVLERNGGKVNFDDPYYDQPLSRAIDSGSSKIAKALLEAGADPTRPYSYGYTPVDNAASNGMLDVVKALIARGADVDGVVGSESLDFGAALRWASWHGHEETALWLLENKAAIDPADPSLYPLWDKSALLNHAVVGGNLAVVQRLVAMGARSEDSLRLFVATAQGGSTDVLSLLFAEGYELPDVDHHDRIYDAVIDVVKEEGDGRIEDGVEMFEMFLQQGLSMSKLTESGWNYGHQAVIHFSPATAREESAGDRRAVVDAQRMRFVQLVVDATLASGINIDQRYEGRTMLMAAADGGHAQLVRQLLELGADADLKNDEGKTALEIAAQEGRRLIGFWDENDSLKRRFTSVLEALGGTEEMLNQPENAKPDS